MTGTEFARRVTELTPMLYRICFMQLHSPADREDAVQEAIFRAWKKQHTLRHEEYFNTWLVRILINVCHDIQKKQKRIIPVDTIPEPPSEGASRDEELRYALAALDEKLRLPVLMHYIEGYSVREVADMLGLGVSGVKLRLMRGRKQLRDLLSEEVF